MGFSPMILLLLGSMGRSLDESTNRLAVFMAIYALASTSRPGIRRGSRPRRRAMPRRAAHIQKQDCPLQESLKGSLKLFQ